MKTSNSILVDRYSYRVCWSDEDDEFVGLCAEFPSLSWLAKSREGALKGIVAVVRQCIEDLQCEDQPRPLSSRAYSGIFKIRIPSLVHRNLAVEAAEAGISLNRLVSAKLSHGG